MNKNTKGTVLILISALFYGSYGIWSRLMIGNFGEFSQAWTRGLFLLLVIAIIGSFLKVWKKIQLQDIKWFLLIALAGGLNQAPYYFGFAHLTIGTATLLFYAALVVGGYILGKVAFNEKLTGVKIVSLVVALLGMFVIYGFTLSPGQYFPAFATVIAGFMGAITVVMPKKLIENYHEVQVMAGYFIMQVIFNLPMAIIFNESLPQMVNLVPWFAQLGYAFAMLVANISAIAGFGYIEASKGSLIGLAEIIFGIVFGLLFFGEVVSASVLAGASLIIVSAALPNIEEMLMIRKR